jgi:hypothetical protein
MLKFSVLILFFVVTSCASVTQNDTTVCPVVTLRAHVYLMGALTPDQRELVRQLVEVAEMRNTRNGTDLAGYEGRSVSRELRVISSAPSDTAKAPADMRLDVYRQGTFGKSPVGALSVVQGTGSLILPNEARSWRLRIVFPTEDILSPIESGGSRQLVIFPDEWRSFCTMSVTGVAIR